MHGSCKPGVPFRNEAFPPCRERQEEANGSGKIETCHNLGVITCRPDHPVRGRKTAATIGDDRADRGDEKCLLRRLWTCRAGPHPAPSRPTNLPQASRRPPELQPGRTLHFHFPLSTLPQANPRRIHGILTPPRIRLHRSLGRAPENRPLCRVDRATVPRPPISPRANVANLWSIENALKRGKTKV